MKNLYLINFKLSGFKSFGLGIFLLPSSAFLGGIFLVLSVFLADRKNCKKYFEDTWNYPFFLSGILMFLGCIKAYSSSLAWIGLANWLPFFWAFWAFQPYLKTNSQRKQCALLFVAGTIPVLVTGFGQLWFDWEGPWQIFRGLIIWYVDKDGEPDGRLSGLFNYANIAGAWLAFVWPFGLAALLQPKIKGFQRFIVFFIVTSIVTALVLTDSRNAWGALILAIPFVLGPITWPWLIPFLFISFLPVAFAVLPWFGFEVQSWARSFVPEAIWARLSDFGYVSERNVASTRLNQWRLALDFISKRPWLGWGAAAFSVLYPLITGYWHGHAHNLPLELAVSSGLPVAIIIICSVLALLIITLKTCLLQTPSIKDQYSYNNIFDRAWWSSALIMVFLHGADLPFFDSRLNIAGWILLAGLRCLISASTENNEFNSKQDRDVELNSLV